MGGEQDSGLEARRLPLISLERLAGADDATIDGLLASGDGPSLGVTADVAGDFAIEPVDLGLDTVIGHAAALVVARRSEPPADGRLYLVRLPEGEVGFRVFGETDYITTFAPVPGLSGGHAVKAGLCTVLGRATALIALL
jgi:hypothetical protein